MIFFAFLCFRFQNYMFRRTFIGTRNFEPEQIIANMLVTAKQLFNHCYGQYGIAAVNVEFMEQILGLFAAAEAATDGS